MTDIHGDLNDADLQEMETEIGSSESLGGASARTGQMLQRALWEIRKLRHALVDPNFMFASGRVTRTAIVCRNETIRVLQERITELGKN